MAWFCVGETNFHALFSFAFLFFFFASSFVPRYGPWAWRANPCCLLLAFWGILICSGTRQTQAGRVFWRSSPAAKPKKIAATGGEQREREVFQMMASLFPPFPRPCRPVCPFFSRSYRRAYSTRRGSANSRKRESRSRGILLLFHHLTKPFASSFGSSHTSARIVAAHQSTRIGRAEHIALRPSSKPRTAPALPSWHHIGSTSLLYLPISATIHISPYSLLQSRHASASIPS